MNYSDYVMTSTTEILYLPNTLHKLLLQYDLHSSYNQTKYIGEEEIMHNIFSKYLELLLNYINHSALLKEWKINIDAPAYENN